MIRFLDLVVHFPIDFDWRISVDVVEGAILRTTDSIPDPGGIPYAAWRSLSGKVALPIHAAVEGGHSWRDGAPGGHRSTITSLPKATPVGLVECFTAEVEATRPSTLTDTCPKVMALAFHDRLAALAWATVMPQQRDFIAGRVLGDNLYEVEAAMVAYSCMRQRSLATVFFDFRTAIPSLAHRWLMMVLCRGGGGSAGGHPDCCPSLPVLRLSACCCSPAWWAS